jgi:hypothetical protein
MTERYNQQDGSPDPRPDSGEAVSDPNNARPAVVGERSTQEDMGGQGLGQYKGEEGKPGSTDINRQADEG